MQIGALLTSHCSVSDIQVTVKAHGPLVFPHILLVHMLHCHRDQATLNDKAEQRIYDSPTDDNSGRACACCVIL